MSEGSTFQRAYSRRHKEQRAADLMEAARTLGARDGIRAVTLTAIATHAGVHASAVRRYYASREEILLALAEEGYADWSQDIAARLAGLQRVASNELAGILTASLAERPLFCDLLTHVTLSLEREVSYERVHAFKSVAIIAVGALTDAITAASTLDKTQAGDVIIGLIAMTASLWQAGHPAETLTRLYAEEPSMAHIGIDFEPTLTRLTTALIDGMTHPQQRSARIPSL
ncbi:TetR family transcriptional regulator [Planotetraspora sp. A-T 1434]|uniref:TetR/AcrR family transcriptional regulator n=1 Tax=Planotetraspora sp. A-T 1434 TaxID=2979219 RepID=UPI0021C1D7FE|nr:TetR family transcriptional regulator [Planotetraspora sp. A-T 1434]MCT9933627.1 TetR family transcriptional regulator [Planotetraspora sp. A-T 1434]